MMAVSQGGDERRQTWIFIYIYRCGHQSVDSVLLSYSVYTLQNELYIAVYCILQILLASSRIAGTLHYSHTREDT